MMSSLPAARVAAIILLSKGPDSHRQFPFTVPSEAGRTACEGVGGDTTFAQLRGKDAGELVKSRLGRRVCVGFEAGDSDAVYTSDVDDSACSLFSQRGAR
jgi:hypothetical protein